MNSSILGSLASSSANFSAAGMNHLDPEISDSARMAIGLPSAALPHGDTGMQTVLKCAGDYSKMPYGWRPAPFMGHCGFKIQLNKFYSATSPCYPIQDISCMGAVEKKAWANMCKTEFPCKPMAWPKPARLDRPTEHAESSWFDVLVDDLPALLGVSLAGCLSGAAMVSSKKSHKSDNKLPEDELKPQ